MSAEWTITGLTYDREKAERTLDNNNRQASCSVLFSAQCASFKEPLHKRWVIYYN